MIQANQTHLQTAPKRPTRPLEPHAGAELIARVLDKMDTYSVKPMRRCKPVGYIVGCDPHTNRAIVVVDGDFGRQEFKAVFASLADAGFSTNAIIVVARTATYSGQSIHFSKFEDLGLTEP